MGRRRAKADEAATWPRYFADRASRSQDPALRAFYEAGMPDPDTPIGEVEMVALDFETTGMDVHQHAIVSVGLVPFTLQRIRPAQGHYWVVRPPRPLDEASIRFHRITHAEVSTAPELDTILDRLLSLLAGKVVVVHYQGIERPFLDAAVLDRRGERCLFPLIDTMNLEARQVRQGWWRRVQTLLGVPQTSIRLGDSRARYGLPSYSAHHAKLDALATAELLQAQVAKHHSPETPLGDLWS
ncbi:3'-5' exonuclease [Guyparkeria hydrothermalis]|uniref:3'-5' exonuclease n=1 Tax=Guyparkeria hydrothermalis TaxID=923 RepID=UPI002020C968|nr:3'-5' exonuclease [Guyparkeria hydrothermalis]MCL7743965.1 3'-5' exonuclease [Guyparkeria hydrothermalis]